MLVRPCCDACTLQAKQPHATAKTGQVFTYGLAVVCGADASIGSVIIPAPPALHLP
ncbi:hypothetical protein BDW22DRAFT_693172 [Trametopsis cervina]|nr:hypothetical protein BDW22DRAFT_693172 [Trametopsis cervina]